jgi:RND family efflux transporter MFP subunit
MALAAGGGYLVYARASAAAQASDEPELQTATVTRGDIVLSALGSGVLMPEAEIDLVFATGGRVAEVLVAVGDQVRAGDVLARLDATDLERAVVQAEFNLRQAEIDLEEALEPADEATIQAAQDSVDQAAAALRLERIQYQSIVSGTLLTESLPDAQENYEARLADYNCWSSQYNEGQADYWFVEQAEERLEGAEEALMRTQLQAEETVQAANNSLAQAVDQLRQAQANLEALLAEPSERTVERLELNVQQAEMSLNEAREDLANATLTAPFDGVVTAVAAEAGETVGSGTAVVTLADMDPPLIECWIEEADLSMANVGNPVNIVFEALPDLTFSGQIVRVEPTLVTVDGTSAVQLWTSVDTSAYAARLYAGMNAEVEIVAAEVLDALIVPVQALRELGPDQHAVFVVSESGQLELRPVEVGLQDYVSAEIIRGLELGQVVSIGEAATASSVEVPSAEMPGGGFMFPGGGGP